MMSAQRSGARFRVKIKRKHAPALRVCPTHLISGYEPRRYPVMLSIGRIFAGDGWRYLWEQVGTGAEDYHMADVAGGERPGRWWDSACGLELGLSGEVTKEQMHRLFGLLVHPSEPVGLGRAPRVYRSLEERLAAARESHDDHEQAVWLRRAVELAETRPRAEQIEAEHRAHLARAAEEWAEREAAIRRGGDRHAVAGFDLCFSPQNRSACCGPRRTPRAAS
jgi:hypothetical protein